MNGRPSNNEFDDGSGNWSVLPTKFTRRLQNGQALRHTTAAAGGYVDPLEREPERVLFDVRNGKVTIDAAARDYGVRILSAPWRIDNEATVELRNKLRHQPKAAA